MKEGLYEFGPGNMDLNIYTYKSGFLSSLAYDLFIKATDFKLRADIKGENSAESKMNLVVNAGSLKVVSLMVDNKIHDIILTEGQKKEIESEFKGSRLLNIKKYPKITFTSKNIFIDADCHKVTGDLAIKDAVREIELILKKDNEKPDKRIHGSFDLYQSKFGIRPYTSMFGTLSLKDKIEIKWEINIPDFQ